MPEARQRVYSRLRELGSSPIEAADMVECLEIIKEINDDPNIPYSQKDAAQTAAIKAQQEKRFPKS